MRNLIGKKMELVLRNGTTMPWIGLGTYKMNEADLERAIPIALDLGYRLFDTAVGYRNEAFLSRILKRELPLRGLSRSSIFITSKIRPADHGYDRTLASLRQSAAHFDGYVDLYLIHWPGAAKLSPDDERNATLRHESWFALQEALKEGRCVRAIGVSNFAVKHLRQLSEHPSFEIAPLVNQYELHPSYHPLGLVEYCHEHQIHLQSYSTLGTGQLLTETYRQTNPFLETMIRKYSSILCEISREQSPLPSSSPLEPSDLSASTVLASVYLAWARQSSFSAIPKSLDSSHLRSNLLSQLLSLSDEEMSALDQIQEQRQEKFCWDPQIVL
jgi:diketogulonate reductase-like aldo/keto reductase